MDVVEEPNTAPVITTRLMEPLNPSPRFQSDTELGSNSPHRPATSIINGVLRISDLSSGSVAGNRPLQIWVFRCSMYFCVRSMVHITKCDRAIYIDKLHKVNSPFICCGTGTSSLLQLARENTQFTELDLTGINLLIRITLL